MNSGGTWAARRLLGHGRIVDAVGDAVGHADALERHGDRAAAAEAQRREAVAALPARELVEQRRHDPGPARADRVAERDRPAVDVDLVPVEAELPAIGEGLGGERLVDLDQVERLDRQLDPVEQPADALDRGEEQPLRLDLGLGVADDPGQGLQAEPLDRALAGDDRRRGAVRDPGRVAGRDRPDGRAAAILALGQGERGLESRQRLDASSRGAGPRRR